MIGLQSLGALALLCASAHCLTLQGSPLSEGGLLIEPQGVAAIHQSQVLWTAVDAHSTHRFKTWTVADFKRLLKPLGVFQGLTNSNEDPLPIDPSNPRHVLPVKTMASNLPYTALPSQFDARQKWYDCQTIPMVRDQGKCGSCWAFGTTGAMSDRTCIHSKGRYQAMISALDIMSCCAYCSTKYGGYGCEGGESQDGYHYWNNTGIVTGDGYGTAIGCKPYPFASQLAHVPGSIDSPMCVDNCTNNLYNGSYTVDRVRAKHVYQIKPLDTQAAMWDLYHNGPLTVSYNVYKDFPAYSHGVYVRTTKELLGGHNVVIIGWGEDDGVPYWTVKNSWNRVWGMHGFFKIRRGTNEAGIEEEMVGGIPDTPENTGSYDLA